MYAHVVLGEKLGLRLYVGYDVIEPDPVVVHARLCRKGDSVCKGLVVLDARAVVHCLHYGKGKRS